MLIDDLHRVPRCLTIIICSTKYEISPSRWCKHNADGIMIKSWVDMGDMNRELFLCQRICHVLPASVTEEDEYGSDDETSGQREKLISTPPPACDGTGHVYQNMTWYNGVGIPKDVLIAALALSGVVLQWNVEIDWTSGCRDMGLKAESWDVLEGYKIALQQRTLPKLHQAFLHLDHVFLEFPVHDDEDDGSMFDI
jgi:hypothetical protein